MEKLTFQRVRPLLPWAATVLVLVLVLPAASFVRNRMMGPDTSVAVERKLGDVRSAGARYASARRFQLDRGNGSRQLAIIGPDKAEGTATFEMVAPTPDEKAVWIADHPTNAKPGARVRKFSTDGKLLSSFSTPSGTTLFTPGMNGDLWVIKAPGADRTEMLLHYNATGRLLAKYPLPQGLFSRSIAPAPDGSVWVLSEEWLLDPATRYAEYSGVLVKIVEPNGKPVEKPVDNVSDGTFIGADGRFYSLKGGMPSGVVDFPPFEITATDPVTGKTTKYRTKGGYRPFAADKQGRIYAESRRPDRPDSPGIAILGDQAVAPVDVLVLDESGEVARLKVALPQTVSPWAPAAWPTGDGALWSGLWADGGFDVMRTELRPSDSSPPVADDRPSMPQVQVIVPFTAPFSGDPYVAIDDSGRDLWQLVYDGLVSHDASLTAVPDLAVSVPRSGDGVSSDGLTVTWVLNEDRLWHDGRPVTAEDVVATWEYLKRPGILSRGEPFPGFDTIRSVEADGQKVVVRLNEQFGIAPEAFFPFILPKHVVEAPEATGNGGLHARPIGSGPYRVARWESDGTMMLEGHAGAGVRPTIGRIDVRFVKPEELTKTFMASMGPAVATWLLPSDRETLKRDAFGAVQAAETGRWTGLLFNIKDAVIADPRVRQAIEQSYPRATSHIVYSATEQSVTVGPFQTAREQVPASGWRSDPSTASASSILDKAGWRMVKGSLVRSRGGRDLRLIYSLAARAKYPHEIPVEIFEPVVKRWGSMGAASSWNNSVAGFYYSPWEDGYLSTMRHGVAGGVFPMPQDPAWGSVFDPTDAPSWQNPYGLGVTGTDDAELRSLHQQARRSYDPVKRAELARRIAERVRELRLAVFDHPQKRYSGVLAIQNYKPAPYPAGDFWNAASWDVAQ